VPTEEFSANQLVPWLLIVVGWMIVNYQNNVRETRKEARAMADAAKKTAIEVSSKAVDFFTSADASGLALKSSLELLEIELERFPLFSAGSKLLVCFTAFAEVITGDDFESRDRSVKEPTSPEINAVFRTRNELLAEIERQFKVHFC
jgi:hypothetical protein